MGEASRAEIKVPTSVTVGAPLIGLMLIIPLAWLIWITSGLESTARAQRREAMTLIGLPRSMLWIVGGAEGMIAGVVGAALGALFFLLIKPIVAPAVPLGTGVWPEDISPPIGQSAVVLALVILFVALCDAASSARSGFTPQPGRNHRRHVIIGLCAAVLGVAMTASSFWWPDQDDIDTRGKLLLAGFLLLCISTTSLGREIAREVAKLPMRARRPWLLIAGSVTQRQSGNTAGMAGALAILVLVTGIMLSLFPTLGEAGSSRRTKAAEMLGRRLLIAPFPTNDPSKFMFSSAAILTVEHPAVNSSSPSPQIKVWFDCRGLSVHADPPTCSAKAVDAARIAFAAQGIPLPEEISTGTAPHTTYESHDNAIDSPSKVTYFIFQPSSDEQLEMLRTSLIHQGFNGSSLQTLGEQSDAALQVTRPFIAATIAGMTMACLVAVFSLTTSLIAQVVGRRDGLRGLRIAGVSLASLRAALMLQACLNVWPTVALAWLGGLATGTAFIKLSTTGVELPIVPSMTLALSAAICAPLAVVFTRRTLDHVSDPAENHE
ncbi:hypothetical protein [Austwickia chelonae]|uniref:hypothetical protein n=1 Tax=Austwickia chelonae TaxID=100225 RepID=UPI0013C3773A|nr:hypothetical protein [Austwickia chelonae]